MKCNFKRFMSLVLSVCTAMAMCSFTTAAEEYDTPETPIDVEESVGSVIAYGSSTFTNSTTISVYLDSGNWSADFLVCVTGNANAKYEVVMTTPSGSVYTTFITSNGGTFTNMATLAYASKGTYNFKFTRVTGSANTAHATVEICD